jgi:hypothetical protein
MRPVLENPAARRETIRRAVELADSDEWKDAEATQAGADRKPWPLRLAEYLDNFTGEAGNITAAAFEGLAFRGPLHGWPVRPLNIS